jgi:hypothetical protein
MPNWHVQYKNWHTGKGHIVYLKRQKNMYEKGKERGGLGHLTEGWLGQPD